MKLRILPIMVALATGLTGCSMSASTGNSGETSTQPSAESSGDNTTNGGEANGSITLSLYTDDEFYKQAAQAFMDENPGTEVKIDVFQPQQVITDANGNTMGNNPNNKADYIAELSTEFMSGNAPDLIDYGTVPFYQYANSGYLEDLTSYINADSDFNNDNYFLNIFDAAKFDSGQLYVLPTMFGIKELGFTSNFVKDAGVETTDENNQTTTWSEAIKYAEKVKDNLPADTNAIVWDGSAERLANNIFSDNFDDFVNLETGAVNINSNEFINLLEGCKQLEVNGYITNENNDFSNSIIYDDDLTMQAICFQGSGEYVDEKPLANQSGKVEANISGLLMCSNSLNKDLDWQFMKFVDSKEMQTSSEMFGAIPVNKEAFSTCAINFINGNNNYDGSSGDNESFAKSMTDTLSSWIELVDGVSTFDSNIFDMADKELQKYFDGTETAEVAANNLQNEVELYLAE